ncbi:MAG: SBBP repeat-containing protein [Planctomycetota bacterium]|jgi:hypothetical protein
MKVNKYWILFVLLMGTLMGGCKESFDDQEVSLWDILGNPFFDRENNMYVLIPSWNSETGHDYLIKKYDKRGTEHWSQKYNGHFNGYDTASDLVVDSNGNVYVTGNTQIQKRKEEDEQDIFAYTTVKYNADGKQIWRHDYEIPEMTFFGSPDGITADNHGNVYITGRDAISPIDIVSYVDHFITIKYDANGAVDWVHKYPEANCNMAESGDISTDNTGSIYVTSTIEQDPDPYNLACTIKYNFKGELLWESKYKPEKGSFSFPKITTNTDEHIFVFGVSIRIKSSCRDLICIKYNTNGQEQWSTHYEIPIERHDHEIVIPMDIETDRFGNVYILAWYTKYKQQKAFDSPMQRLESEFITIKYNPKGKQEWVAKYNDAKAWIHNIFLGMDSDVYLIGSVTDEDEHKAGLIIRYDEQGKEKSVTKVQDISELAGVLKDVL